MQGFKFFRKSFGLNRGRWDLVSYHSPHSLTWNWYIGFSLLRKSEPSVFPICWRQKVKEGSKTMAIRAGLRIPFIGTLRYSRQKPIWYRDLYNDLRNRPPYMIVNQEPDVWNGGRGKTERVSAKIIRFKQDALLPPYES